jgi:hypothetical protein
MLARSAGQNGPASLLGAARWRGRRGLTGGLGVSGLAVGARAPGKVRQSGLTEMASW